MIQAGAPRALFESLDSTNAEAARRASQGDYGPIWVRTEHQSAGRGRRGRSWLSAPGNLFLTYLGHTPRPLSDVALLGFCAGVALTEVLEERLGTGRASLKWPNDLLLDGKKAAGILLESGAAHSGGHWFAMGVGVNLAEAPQGLDRSVAALGELLVNAAPTAPEVQEAFIARVTHWAGRLEGHGFSPLREAWLARAHGLNGPIVADTGSGRSEGIFEDLSPCGELCLRALPSQELVRISAGDVYFPETCVGGE